MVLGLDELCFVQATALHSIGCALLRLLEGGPTLCLIVLIGSAVWPCPIRSRWKGMPRTVGPCSGIRGWLDVKRWARLGSVTLRQDLFPVALKRVRWYCRSWVRYCKCSGIFTWFVTCQVYLTWYCNMTKSQPIVPHRWQCDCSLSTLAHTVVACASDVHGVVLFGACQPSSIPLLHKPCTHDTMITGAGSPSGLSDVPYTVMVKTGGIYGDKDRKTRVSKGSRLATCSR